MQPDNHVEAPDLAIMMKTGPNDPRFWDEVGQGFSWAKHLWVGPNPSVTIDLKQVYPRRQFSPQEIYAGIVDAISGLKLPGVVVRPQIIHEGGPFSPYRAYLQIRRELSEFLICAAPAGNSFFITVRKIDRFVHVKWFHYLLVILLLAALVVGASVVFGNPGGLVFSMVLLSLVWSLMRYACFETASWLAENLPSIPLFGGLYLRWFRPDTYFRQDLHTVFLSLADNAIKDVLSGLAPELPKRPAVADQGAPVMDLKA